MRTRAQAMFFAMLKNQNVTPPDPPGPLPIQYGWWLFNTGGPHVFMSDDPSNFSVAGGADYFTRTSTINGTTMDPYLQHGKKMVGISSTSYEVVTIGPHAHLSNVTPTIGSPPFANVAHAKLNIYGVLFQMPSSANTNLYRDSTDTTNWAARSSPTGRPLAIGRFRSGRWYMMTNDYRGWYSDDIGPPTNWKRCQGPSEQTARQLIPVGDDLLCIFNNTDTAYLIDDQINWSVRNDPGQELGTVNIVVDGWDRNGDTIIWTDSNSQRILRTPDAGVTFQTINTPGTYGGAIKHGGNGVWIMSSSSTGTMLYSVDDGVTWNPVTLPTTYGSSRRMKAFPVIYGGGDFVIEGTMRPTGRIGRAYAGSVNIKGGFLPHTVTVVAGSTPPGLAIETHGEIIGFSGTPTGTPDTYTFTLKAVDVDGREAFSEQTIEILEAQPGYGAHRYWRLRMHTAFQTGSPYAYYGVATFGLYDVNGVREFVNPVDAQCTASSQFSAQYPSRFAYDTIETSAWYSANGGGTEQWIQYDAGVGNALEVFSVMVQCTEFPETAPRNFAVEYSDDGVTWGTPLNVLGAVLWGSREKKYYSLV